MNRSLVKMIDAALFPAAMMVVGKFIGLAITLNLFQLPWTINQVNDGWGLSSATPAVKFSDLQLVSTYSDLILIIIMGAAFSIVLVQATILHQKNISPRLLIKLSNANLLSLVRSSYDIYHYAIIWLLFVWVSSISIFINVATLKTELWVGVVALAAAVSFTTILLQDVSKEISLSRKNLGKQQAF